MCRCKFPVGRCYMCFIVVDHGSIFFFCVCDILPHFAGELLIIVLLIRKLQKVFYLVSEVFVFDLAIFWKRCIALFVKQSDTVCILLSFFGE